MVYEQEALSSFQRITFFPYYLEHLGANADPSVKHSCQKKEYFAVLKHQMTKKWSENLTTCSWNFRSFKPKRHWMHFLSLMNWIFTLTCGSSRWPGRSFFRNGCHKNIGNSFGCAVCGHARPVTLRQVTTRLSKLPELQPSGVGNIRSKDQ